MALAGCGHKTSPKYIPTAEEIAANAVAKAKSKVDSNDTNVSTKG
jgi:predicted small lipoprotein YifL